MTLTRYICSTRTQSLQLSTNKTLKAERSSLLFLLENMNNINPKKIKPNTEFIAQNVIYYKTVNSTNDVAKKTDCANGTLFVADAQTSGKGRMGRSWSSAKNEGIYMTVALKPEINPKQISFITLVTGLAVCKTLIQLYNIDFKIKWPNDILADNKKVCGILVEAVTDGNKLKVINGIGINVNQEKFPEEIKNKAISLYILTGKKSQKVDIINNFSEIFEKYYKEYLHGNIAKLISEYKELCVTLNREITVMKNGSEIKATAIEITPTGKLLAKKNDGTILEINSGEVSVQGIY